MDNQSSKTRIQRHNRRHDDRTPTTPWNLFPNPPEHQHTSKSAGLKSFFILTIIRHDNNSTIE